MLIIELDGNINGEYQQIERDEVRDNYLKNLGFTVIRFENKLVFQDPEFVIKEIKKRPPKKIIKLINHPVTSSSPTPLLQKEGRVKVL